MRYTDEEMACIEVLAQLFEKGQIQSGWLQCEPAFRGVGIPPDRVIPVLTALEEHGIINGVTHSDLGQFTTFRITSRAVEVSREIAFSKQEQAERQSLLQMQFKREQEEREWREAQRREDLRRAEEQRKADLEWKLRQEAQANRRLFWQVFIVGIMATLVLSAATIIGALIQASAMRDTSPPPFIKFPAAVAFETKLGRIGRNAPALRRENKFDRPKSNRDGSTKSVTKPTSPAAT